jgi:hypothetical protein
MLNNYVMTRQYKKIHKPPSSGYIFKLEVRDHFVIVHKSWTIKKYWKKILKLTPNFVEP